MNVDKVLIIYPQKKKKSKNKNKTLMNVDESELGIFLVL